MFRTTLVCASAALLLCAQPARFAKGRQSMEIVLERHDAGGWHAIDSGLVLDQGDLVRFRFRANFNGYLYVIDSGTSGTKLLLFPKEATGLNNRIAANTNYSVPATATSFKVSGPAGHDVVYWLVSPAPLASDTAQTLMHEESTKPPPSMTPRCNDSLFGPRARCIDSTAGPRNATSDSLPESLSSLPNRTKRELTIIQDKDAARLSSPEPLTGPVIYEFHLAHR